MTKPTVVLADRISSAILLLRGEKVLLDADLASLWRRNQGDRSSGETNAARFPEDFVFQLTKAEFDNLRYQSGTSSSWGGRRTGSLRVH